MPDDASISVAVEDVLLSLEYPFLQDWVSSIINGHDERTLQIVREIRDKVIVRIYYGGDDNE